MFSVELQDPLSYHILVPVLAALLMIVALAVCLVIFLRFRPIRAPKERKIEIVRPAPATLEEIRRRYLQELMMLRTQAAGGAIERRQAYQRLSKLIRGFVQETTGIEVQNYSLSEIRKLGIVPLTDLMSEYYEPEFALRSAANLIQSLDRTQGVVQAWR